MNRFGLIAATLAVAAALAGGSAHASPRAAQDTGGAMTPDADMDVWLRRLVGRYSFEGIVEVTGLDGCKPKDAGDGGAPLPSEYCESIKGKGDCVAIGEGPGVQCVLNVMWQDMYHVDYDAGRVYEVPGGVSYLDPSMALFGFDPANARLRYLLVDHKGLPEGGLGLIKGNTATFRTECVNAPALLAAMEGSGTACQRTIRLDIKPDSKVVHWAMDIEILTDGEWILWTRFEMTLRRTAEDKAE